MSKNPYDKFPYIITDEITLRTIVPSDIIFHNFDIERIRHVDYCYLNHQKIDCKYYYINAHKK